MILKNRFIRFATLLSFVVSLSAISCHDAEEVSLPEFITSAVDIITPASARCVANVTVKGSNTLSDRGVCWSTENMPDLSDSKVYSGTETGEFSTIITGLAPLTTYYARAFASNSAGTVFGEEIEFTTTQDRSGETGTMTDRQGHVYPTIGIGSQIWMAANLKSTRFHDSTEIPFVDYEKDWMELESPAYCYYNNLEGNSATYGVLYNWYAAAATLMCPPGWHLPSDTEWSVLTVFLGGEEDAGSKLKETGTGHWHSPNGEATNESGFTALPAGYRAYIGVFSSILESAVFWSFTGNGEEEAWGRLLEYQNNTLARVNISTRVGASIRLVKDN